MKIDIKKIYSEMMSKYSIYFILLIMIIVSSFLNSNFLTFANFSNISSQLAVTTILACGATMLIISGMIDLSCGSVLALAGVLSVASYKATNNMILAILVAIVVGVICNLINGIMITRFKVPPFIATLAMLTMARGAALKYTSGQNIYQIGDYTILGQGTLPGGIPISVLFLILFVVITWYILTHKKLGRALYAIGGNEEAAVASGINVNRSKIEVFIINGIFVGFAGVLFMSRNNVGLPNGAVSYELKALTAAVIGGTSFSGGLGTAQGTIAGAFIVGFLDNIMTLIGVDSYIQQIIRGAIIAVAVIYDLYSKNKTLKNKIKALKN
ncbi:ABC transporter permease [uncultured Brachyspira sp.]|uniref:ABC transporter permease n=1 Tax=uncultured Brachyspira sp. TaxID=221953 RepID=UPI002631577B|nr:ABC transporter permease [uncultured Brachyspira sp.]